MESSTKNEHQKTHLEPTEQEESKILLQQEQFMESDISVVPKCCKFSDIHIFFSSIIKLYHYYSYFEIISRLVISRLVSVSYLFMILFLFSFSKTLT